MVRLYQNFVFKRASSVNAGMLGFGHNAEFLEKAVAAPQCMANIMTPSFSQHAFHQEFVKHVGFTRKSGNPYSRVFAMNSGSEAVELSARLTDTHAKLMTDAGAVHEGRRSTIIVLEGSFYGRTCVAFALIPLPFDLLRVWSAHMHHSYRAARFSHSCRETYKKHLASFQHADCHLPLIVQPNNIESLKAAFETAEKHNMHVEAMYAVALPSVCYCNISAGTWNPLWARASPVNACSARFTTLQDISPKRTTPCSSSTAYKLPSAHRAHSPSVITPASLTLKPPIWKRETFFFAHA
jgi:hypothetical protein